MNTNDTLLALVVILSLTLAFLGTLFWLLSKGPRDKH
jgi:hypothetical protein